MRFVVISDIHIGRYKYGKLNNKTGLDKRTEDIIKNIDESIDFAISKKVDCFIVTGDFYHKKRPLEIFRKLIASKINRLLKEKISVFLMLGNHDQGKTSGHDLIELSEISDHVENLYIVDTPQSFDIKGAVLSFLPCMNKIDDDVGNEYDFNIENIRKYNQIKADYKYFFGHFGTDHSVAGKGFDLGSVIDPDSKRVRVVPLKEFDDGNWTKVYLGDIHKPQELNSFCRHVGSIARVDYGEEFEEKGFYYCEGKEDKFITIGDREFKTFEVDLTKKARDTMGRFCNDVQEFDLSQAVVRLKVRIKASERKLISFDGVEKYLKEETWNYIGKSITEIDDRHDEVTFEENEELDHTTIFLNYLKSIKDEIDEDIFNEVKKNGEEILSEVLNL